MKTVRLTDAQYEVLMNLLDYEFNEEFSFQEEGDRDTELLDKYVDLYDALYSNQARSFIEAVVNKEIVDTMRKKVADLRG